MKAKKEEEKRLRKELELKKKSTSGKDWFKTFESEKLKLEKTAQDQMT